MRNFWLISSLLILTACGSPITRKDLDNANIGTPPSDATAMQIIRKHLAETLIDPDSAKLRCSDPKKGWARLDLFDNPSFGYVVVCGVNAKNRFGGYAGETSFAFLFNNAGGRNLVTNKMSAGGEIHRGLEFDYVD